jgi:OOP family OmpA-OmpF porin
MRGLKTLAVAMAAVLLAAGCATFRDRQWGTCAIAGGIVGAAAGGITGGVVANNGSGGPSDGERGAAIGGGIAGGALIGAILGHALCDPMKPMPAPPPVAAPPPPPPAKGTKLAEIGETFFDFDKAELKTTDGAKDVLAGVVKTMKDNPSLRIVIEGHTDSVGTDAYNQRLSERRASAVRSYLIAQGIEASRISTKGYGESKPKASNETAAGRAQNRRAEVIAD